MARKFSFDKDAIRQFFFLHVEKVIAGFALILLLGFLWIGWSNKPYTAQTPAQLKSLASKADQYIASNDAWETISEHRQGIENTDVRIRQAATNVIDAEKFAAVRLSPKEKQAGLRSDPQLYATEDYDLIVRPLRAVIVRNDTNPALASLSMPGDEEEDEESSNRPGAGGSGLEGDQQESRARKEPPKLFGDSTLPIHDLANVGFQPKSLTDVQTVTFNMVEIVGVVPVEKIWARYDQIFKDSRAYTPQRDRPTHAYLEVQRKMVDEPEEKWVTINDSNQKFVEKFFPAATPPEVVDYDYYDKALTSPIPPIIGVDYRKFVLHPKTPMRRLTPQDMLVRKDDSNTVVNPLNFGRSDETEDDEDKKAEELVDPNDPKNLIGSSQNLYTLAGNALKAKAPYKLIRYFDMDPPQQGEFHYRVRVWFEDPNNPPASSISDSGQRKGRDRPGAGTAGLAGDDEGANKNNIGTNFVYVPVDRESLAPEVRRRLDEQSIQSFKDSLPNKALENGVAAEWSGSTAAISLDQIQKQSIGQVFAGTINQGRTDDFGTVSIPRDEANVDMAVNLVVDKIFTYVPFRRTVARGDLLNVADAAKVNLVLPLGKSVRSMKHASGKSGQVVVDIMGGEMLPRKIDSVSLIEQNPVEGYLPEDSTALVSPGEVLVMGPDGTIQVNSNVEQYGSFRASLLLPDETKEYGKPKVERATNSGDGGGAGPG
ncbi:MAG: hypothetical protein R3C03_02330 [Pirellulaceae bacterium]